jgi:hypothetical protein
MVGKATGNEIVGNLCLRLFVLETTRDVMRAYFAKLTPNARMLLAVPAVVIAYMVVTMAVPAVVRAVVPEVVRSVLRLI